MSVRIVCEECGGRPTLDCEHDLAEHIGHRVVVHRVVVHTLAGPRLTALDERTLFGDGIRRGLPNEWEGRFPLDSNSRKRGRSPHGDPLMEVMDRRALGATSPQPRLEPSPQPWFGYTEEFRSTARTRPWHVR